MHEQLNQTGLCIWTGVSGHSELCPTLSRDVVELNGRNLRGLLVREKSSLDFSECSVTLMTALQAMSEEFLFATGVETWELPLARRRRDALFFTEIFYRQNTYIMVL